MDSNRASQVIGRLSVPVVGDQCSTIESHPFTHISVAVIGDPILLWACTGTTAAGCKIPVDPAIPSVLFHLFEPVKKLLSFLFGKVTNFLFDRFDGHTITIALGGSCSSTDLPVCAIELSRFTVLCRRSS